MRIGLVLPFLIPALSFAQDRLSVVHPVYRDAVFAPGSLADLVYLSRGWVCAGDPSIIVKTAGREFGTTVVSGARRCGVALRIALPADVPTGAAEIVANLNGSEEPPIAITIVARRFGFLPGTPAAERGGSKSLTKPVRAGEIVSLRGTGLGTAPFGEVRAEIAGQPLGVESAGPSGEPGVDEIRLRLPPVLTFESCYAPLDVTVDGRIANRVTASIAQSAGTCRHPFQLTSDQMTVLDQGRSIAFASIDLDDPSWVSSTYGYFGIANGENVAAIAGPQYPSGYTGCRVEFEADATTARVSGFLDAGVVAISNSYGWRFQLPLAEWPGPGEWRMIVDGGLDVEPVVHTLEIPQAPYPFSFPSGFVYGPNGEWTVRWDGKRYRSSDEMVLSLTSESIPGAWLACRTPATAGGMMMKLSDYLLLSRRALPERFTAVLRARVGRASDAENVFHFRMVGGVESLGIVRSPDSIHYDVELREGEK